MEKKRKEGAQPKKMQLTQEQYLLFERKQFEFGFMPKRFFAQGKQMMDDLCEKKEEYMDQFLRNVISRNVCIRICRKISPLWLWICPTVY